MPRRPDRARRCAAVRLTVSAGIVAGLLAGCADRTIVAEPTAPVTTSSAPDPSAPAAVTIDGEPRDVATGLDAPWSLVFSGTTAIVSERDSGRIIEVGADGGTREITTVAGTVSGGEGGLLGLALDGDDLFVYSTGTGGNRIERYGLSGEQGSLALGPPTTIVDGLPSAGNHNGGRIAIGPDGMLYASVGDAGDRGSAQDPDSLGGKILRMTPEGEVPPDNPDPDSLVYSLGHRNVQGIAWAEDGRMFATEFGQDTWDELNEISAGANYGWPVVEGAVGDPDFVDPLQQWSPDDASPSGMAIVGGTIVIANLRGQSVRLVPVADPSTATVSFAGEFGRIRDVAIAQDGELWFLTNNTDGRGDPRADDDRILSVPLSTAPYP